MKKFVFIIAPLLICIRISTAVAADRWIKFAKTNDNGISTTYYYDKKSIKYFKKIVIATGQELGTSVTVWVKKNTQKPEHFEISCYEREMDGIAIEPDSWQEKLYDKLCSLY